MTSTILKGQFASGKTGNIFVLLRSAVGAKESVLVVPPFAEEMNKCRRQVTETAEALVGRGLAVLTFDPTGTGDSTGEFSAARWSNWQDDLETACVWAEEAGCPVNSVLAIRIGCALVIESFFKNNRKVAQSIFWQPVVDGKLFMTQFLRLRVAASMMQDGSAVTTDQLRDRLMNGDSLEIAGYLLTPGLWRDLESIMLIQEHLTGLGKLCILEVGSTSTGELSASGRRLVQTARNGGLDVEGRRVNGNPIWSSTEIVVNSELCDLTVSALVP